MLQGITQVSTHLSVGGTWEYRLLPETNMMIASSMAMAGMAKPMPQPTVSCTYTTTVTANKLPMLITR